jgi:hypothetical protein
MKNLLLLINLTLAGMALFSCTRQKGGTPQLDSLQVMDNKVITNQQDTNAINGVGGSQNQGTDKTKMGSNDSTHTIHFHGSPNQNEVDSIKKAKTDKKFN